MLNKSLNYFLLAMLILLTSCGFQLRGKDHNIALKYQIWSINSGGELTLPLKKELLRRKGVTVVDNNDNAAVIQINDINFVRQIQSINRYGGADDYIYTLHIAAQVYFQNKPWGDPIDLNIERYMTYRTDSLVVQDEERTLREEMFSSVADRLVSRLYFLPDLIEYKEQ